MRSPKCRWTLPLSHATAAKARIAILGTRMSIGLENSTRGTPSRCTNGLPDLGGHERTFADEMNCRITDQHGHRTNEHGRLRGVKGFRDFAVSVFVRAVSAFVRAMQLYARHGRLLFSELCRCRERVASCA